MSRTEPAPNPSEAEVMAVRFALGTAVSALEPMGRGLINQTYLVRADGRRYVLQRINPRVFPEAAPIMANLAVLEEHRARHPAPPLRIPALIQTRDGASFTRGEDGAVWRLMEHIPNAQTLERIETAVQAREVGHALGRFHRMVQDLDPASLAVTLPGFHDTPGYLDRFTHVLRTGENAHITAEVRRGVIFIAARHSSADTLEIARREGRIRERVTHGDPKLDNILFDRTNGQAISLIDLDTVQPGLIQQDLGDCLRSCCDRHDASRTDFDLDICREILHSYAEETRPFLGPEDWALLYEAIRLIPFELGLRFLTDHLQGDQYFRVSAPGQNLHRALAQFALVEDIERKAGRISSIIADGFQ